ncbi:MAG: hypothetical protein LBM96_08665 [Methanobrevibacter sp.]|jgi:hypothetical protein|nr:hypothetical protein [Candidatus Methanoflexus mossambicus]
MLIVLISLILLITITLPIVSIAIDYSMDSSNIIETKSEVSKLINAVDMVYSRSGGSKELVVLNLPKATTLSFSNSSKSQSASNQMDMGLASFSYMFSDGNEKTVEIDINAKNINTKLYLNEGLNKVIVYMDDNSKNINFEIIE